MSPPISRRLGYLPNRYRLRGIAGVSSFDNRFSTLHDCPNFGDHLSSVTLLYWDVIGNVSFTLEAKKDGVASPVPLGPYEGKQVERTYVYPSAEIMERVTSGAIDNAIKAMGSDAALIGFLKGE